MDAPRPAAPAIPLLLIAMFAFSVQDLVVKLVTEDVSLWQMQAVRSIAALLLLALLLRLRGQLAHLRPTRLRWPLIRALVLSGAYLFFYASLPFLTLAQAGSGFFTAPILITLLAAVTMGEPLGPRRLGALGVGFVGVLCIIQPGFDTFNPLMLLPLMAASCYAAGVVLTRWRCAGERPWALAAVHNTLYAAIGLIAMAVLPILPLDPAWRASWPFLTLGWMDAGWLALGLVVVTAVTHMIGALCSAAAYQASDAGRIAPFEYAYLALTPVWDVAVWGLWPDAPTVVGMVLICAAGSATAWDDQRTQARAAR